MKQLPRQPENANERVLAQELRERFENITTTVTLTNPVLTTVDGGGLEAVFVDGVFRDPESYTINGRVLTFAVPLAGTETVVVFYSYRS